VLMLRSVAGPAARDWDTIDWHVACGVVALQRWVSHQTMVLWPHMGTDASKMATSTSAAR